METFDTYENKRTGLTCDEALEAAVCGYRVRYEGMADLAYIHYVFDGWRIQFAGIDGKPGSGSSSRWNPDRDDWARKWEIFDPQPPKLDSWGRPVVNIIAQMGGENPPPNKHELADMDRKASRNKWGLPS